MRAALLCLAVGLHAASLPAQERSASFAVLPFRAEQSFGLDEPTYRALERGIADLMAAELGRSPGGRLAERPAPPEGATAGRVDAAAAQRLGALAGAQYVVLGNFVDAFGKVRVNARVLDVGTGQFVASASNDDPALHDRAQLHRSIQVVAAALLADLGLPAAAPRAAVPTSAITSYSRGLQAEAVGDRAAAAAAYREALATAPTFPEASEAAARVR